MNEVGRLHGRGETALLTRWDGFMDEVGRLYGRGGTALWTR